MVRILRTKLVMRLKSSDSEVVTFDDRDPNDPTYPMTKTIALSRTSFEELGEPDTITVTIEPGDLLNP